MEQGFPLALPGSVIFLTCRGCDTLRIYFQYVLVPKCRLLFNFQSKHGRIPPDYWWTVGLRAMQARTDRILSRRIALRTPIEHAVLTKGRASGRKIRPPTRFGGRI